MTHPQPQLISARLEKFHPTQISVGKREVALKRQQWQALGKKARLEALASHWFPAIAGPGDRYYIVDHHHFGLALIEEEIKMASVVVLKDLSWLEPSKFWSVMDFHQWVHPYDSSGMRRTFDAVPVRLSRLCDDPYRSLAGQLRSSGGFAKDATPYSEFLWADFFRDQIDVTLIEQEFERALQTAKKMAQSQAARYLPGWCGVIE